MIPIIVIVAAPVAAELFGLCFWLLFDVAAAGQAFSLNGELFLITADKGFYRAAVEPLFFRYFCECEALIPQTQYLLFLSLRHINPSHFQSIRATINALNGT